MRTRVHVYFWIFVWVSFIACSKIQAVEEGNAIASMMRSSEFEKFDAAQEVKDAFTHVGKFYLEQESWYGPLVVHNQSNEQLLIEGYHVASPSIEISSIPESIAPNTVGVIEVIFSPKRTGMASGRIELTTSQGSKWLTLQGIVLVQDPVSELKFTLPKRVHFSRIPRISVEEFREVFKDASQASQMLLIDPRPSTLYRQAHIAGAINLPLYELKYRAAWKERKIVIVDEGAELQHIAQEILLLQHKGFKDISWLRGGLRMLQATDLRLVGSNIQSGQWAKLSAAEFFQSGVLDDASLIVLDHKEQALFKALYSEKNVITLKEFTTSSGEFSGPAILIGADENIIPKLEALIHSAQHNGMSLFYCSENWDGITDYLHSKQVNKVERWKYVKADSSNPRGKLSPKSFSDLNCIDCN